MTFYIAASGFLAFLIFYAVGAGAILYHLNAFSLPEWRGRKVAIVIFTVLSIFFVTMAVIFFFQVPWNAYALAS